MHLVDLYQVESNVPDSDEPKRLMVMHHFLLNDPYLRRLAPDKLEEIETRLRYWGLTHPAFEETLDNWFGNFESQDKGLAFKLFTNLDYYPADRFIQRINQLGSQVLRILHKEGLGWESVVIVTPLGEGDSAHRHAYDLPKSWGLSRAQICRVDELQDISLTNAALILFNDTYGSGTQFMRELWAHIERLTPQPRVTIIAAITIAKEALDRFRQELPQESMNIYIVPEDPSVSAFDVFSAEETARLREIGKRVYSKHPLGFGSAALMTAYYFQCPNNSLPLIWADGKNNAVDNSRPFPWFPLFPYRPKVEIIHSFPAVVIRPNAKGTSDFLQAGNDIGNNDHEYCGTSIYQPPKRLFLHYLDHYYLETQGVTLATASALYTNVLHECRLATRFALLAADEVFVPALSYFDSPLCRKVIGEFRPLFHRGYIWLVGSGMNVLEYLDRKLRQFPEGSPRRKQFLESIRTLPPFRSRQNSATLDIAQDWESLLETEIPLSIVRLSDKVPRDFERRWQEVPDRLEGKAFVADHVYPILFNDSTKPLLMNRLNIVINRPYFESFTQELKSGVVTDLVFLRCPFRLSSFDVNLPYRMLLEELRLGGLDYLVANTPVSALPALKDDSGWRNALCAVLTKSSTITSN